MSDFKMVPLPFDKLENLIPLLHERFEELKDRIGIVSGDNLHHTIREGYALRIVDCYVNDVESPTHLLVLMRVGGIWESSPALVVHSLFISKPYRGNSGAITSMVDTVTKYADFFGLKTVVASSLCDSSGVPLSKLWDKAGFCKSQITYVKRL